MEFVLNPVDRVTYLKSVCKTSWPCSGENPLTASLLIWSNKQSPHRDLHLLVLSNLHPLCFNVCLCSMFSFKHQVCSCLRAFVFGVACCVCLEYSFGFFISLPSSFPLDLCAFYLLSEASTDQRRLNSTSPSRICFHSYSTFSPLHWVSHDVFIIYCVISTH